MGHVVALPTSPFRARSGQFSRVHALPIPGEGTAAQSKVGERSRLRHRVALSRALVRARVLCMESVDPSPSASLTRSSRLGAWLRAAAIPQGQIRGYFRIGDEARMKVRWARFEFHRGALMVVRLRADAADPSARGERLSATTTVVLAREPIAGGEVAVGLLARGCEEHEAEVSALLAGAPLRR